MINGKNLKDLLEAEAILTNSVNDFYAGKSYVYKTISIELRKLLCDTQNKRDISIFGLLFPNLKMKALNNYNMPVDLKKHLIMSMPLNLSFDGKGGVKASLSLSNQYFITKEEWIKQDFVNSNLSVEKFIRVISDKEGAHSDPDIDEYIKQLNGFIIGNEETYKYLIVAIGEFLANIINEIDINMKLRETNEHLFKGNFI